MESNDLVVGDGGFRVSVHQNGEPQTPIPIPFVLYMLDKVGIPMSAGLDTALVETTWGGVLIMEVPWDHHEDDLLEYTKNNVGAVVTLCNVWGEGDPSRWMKVFKDGEVAFWNHPIPAPPNPKHLAPRWFP